MEMEGRMWKEGKFWLIAVPALDAMTQGKTRKEALSMIENWVIETAKSYFESDAKRFKVSVTEYSKDTIGISSNDTKLFVALSLRKQREKSGSTVREASARLGSRSPNAYAQYERGKVSVSLDKYEDLLK